MNSTETSPLPLFDPDPSQKNSQDFDEAPRTFRAIGSAVRMQILSSIAARGKSISELARELHLNRVTLRYHLGYLRSQGLIEEVSPSGPRRVGRPAALYRVSKRARVPGFPQRHFELIGQLALEALVEAVGKKAASSYLWTKGTHVGKSMIDEVASRTKVERWTPDSFERLVLNGLFREFGIPCETLSKSARGLAFRSYGCPFLELAEKMPELVCNALDKGFHSGIDKALGGVKTERVACMGHGDPYCQYRMRWKAKAGHRRSWQHKASKRQKKVENKLD